MGGEINMHCARVEAENVSAPADHEPALSLVFTSVTAWLGYPRRNKASTALQLVMRPAVAQRNDRVKWGQTEPTRVFVGAIEFVVGFPALRSPATAKPGSVDIQHASATEAIWAQCQARRRSAQTQP